MYSSSLTGLNIQYSRSTCEDDEDWISSLDSNVRCSKLSPTDERCHHIDRNGNTGYSSCPKSCGNCFEDSLSSESNTQNNALPMPLYSDETAEINDYDPYMSQNSGDIGDLQDLVYRFTYEINDKIDELSSRIDNTGDEVEIIRTADPSMGICRRVVCENKSSDNLDGSDGQSIDNSCTDINPTCEMSSFSMCQLGERSSCCKYKVDSGGEYPIEPSYSDMDRVDCEKNEDYVWDLITEQDVSEDKLVYSNFIKDLRNIANSVNGDGGSSNGAGRSSNGEGGSSSDRSNQDPFSTGIILYGGSDDTSPILTIENTNQADTSGIKTIENIKYYKLTQDIHSFSIPPGGIKPSNDKKISFCYFTDIEDSSDVKNIQWSKYEFLRNSSGNLKGYPRNGGKKNILVLKISDNYNSSMNEIFEDKTAKYHVFISTLNSKPDNYKLYYKIDNKYNEYKNDSSLSNLYIGFSRNYYNNISLSSSLSYTFTEDTETKLDKNYNNIFSQATNIQAIQPFFFKIFDKDDITTDLDLDIMKFEVKMGSDSILTKDGNTNCKNVDNKLDKWWSIFVFILIVCIAISSGVLYLSYTNNANSSLLMTLFPIILGIIIIITSFISIETYLIWNTIMYFIIVLCISITKFNESPELKNIKTPLIATLSFTLILLTLGDSDVFKNKYKDTSDTNCEVNGYDVSKGLKVGIIIIALAVPILKYILIDKADENDGPPRAASISTWISIILYILFVGGSVFQYVYVMNKTKDMNKTNGIYLGYDNKDDYSLFGNNTIMSIVRDILLII